MLGFSCAGRWSPQFLSSAWRFKFCLWKLRIVLLPSSSNNQPHAAVFSIVCHLDIHFNFAHRLSRLDFFLNLVLSFRCTSVHYYTGIFQGKVRNFPEDGLELFWTLRHSIVFLCLRFCSLKLLRGRTVILVWLRPPRPCAHVILNSTLFISGHQQAGIWKLGR